ncbi:MAG: putative zinc-binding metallopeptidase [Fuerstiella sp.]
MRSFHCLCGSLAFFENTQCLSCSKELGWCPVCQNLTSLVAVADKAGHYRCGNAECGSLLVKCHNYAVESVCNRCCAVPDSPEKPPEFCDYCRFNDTVPDLTVPGNRENWRRLEVAKRRLLYTLDLLQLPYGRQEDGVDPPLTFDFKADTTHKPKWWWSMGREERVYTGHAGGKITINVREADTVEREKARVLFQEAHRTVIGHFRHEIAHYYWQMLIEDVAEAEFLKVFGDHKNPGYTEAQTRYYKDGPVPNWETRFVSAYATMHPWEDFAETFATYLDMVSVLDTATHMKVAESCDPTTATLPDMLVRYISLGVVLNEMNRAMGLTDLVPEIFGAPIAAKLQYVHDLVRASKRPTSVAE